MFESIPSKEKDKTKALKANNACWRKKNIAVKRRQQRMRNGMGQSSRKSR